MRQTDFAKTLTNFLTKYLSGQRNLSTNTIKSYRDAFKQLLIYLQNEENISPEYLTFKELDKEKIEDFLQWLEKTKKVSINTRNQRLAAIHSFYRYVQSENPENLFESQRILGIPFKRRVIKTIEYLTEDCLEIIFQQPNIDTLKGRRDLTLMVLLYDSGARIQELLDLKVRNVRLAKPATLLLSGKGKKERYVPIMEKSKKLLEYYLAEHKLLKNGKEDYPLFFNHSNRPFTRPGITYILEKYLKVAKENHPNIAFPDKLKPHMIRHTKAIHLLEAGVNLIYIRDFLGHASVTTTEHYAKVNSQLKRKALEAAYVEVISEDIPRWTEDQELISWLQNFCK